MLGEIRPCPIELPYYHQIFPLRVVGEREPSDVSMTEQTHIQSGIEEIFLNRRAKEDPTAA